MGTFVPIDLKTGKPLTKAASGGPRLVPMDDYSRERRKALEERDTRTPYTMKSGRVIPKKTASENLGWMVRHSVLGGDAYLDNMPAGMKRALKGGIDKAADIGNALTSQPALPILDELNAGARAAGNEVVNRTWRAARGEKPVDSKAVYRAQMDVDQELKERQRRELPVSTTVGGLLSALPAAPEALAIKGAALAPGAARATPGATAKLMQYGTNVAKGIGVGGAYGGAFGLLDAADGERLEGAGEGATLGAATGGLLEGVGAPAVKGLFGALKTGKGAIDDLVRGLRGPSAEAEAKLGTDTAIKILQRKGLTPETVREVQGRYAPGLEPVASEMAGADVERTVGALARRGGETGDAALALKEQRKAGSGDRVLNAAEENLGVRPEFAGGDVEAAVKRGRKDADPLYATMRDVKAGITTPELEAILQRGYVQDVLRTMEKYSDTAGKEPYGLAWGDVDVPSSPVGLEDLSFAATGAPDSMPVPRGPGVAPSQGPSALTALRQSGQGITEDLFEEAANNNLRLGARKGGAELHDMAIKLHEMGYTPTVLTEAEMEAMLTSGRADNMFAREANPLAQQRFEARQSAEEFNARGGNPEDLPHPDDYGNAGPAPERPLTEPARTRALTQDSWDKVLSGIDNMIKRDGAGRPIMDDEVGFKNRALLQAADDLRAELFGNVETGKPNLVPEMRAARDVSGDYQSINSAFNRMKGKLTTKTFGELQRIWTGAKTEAERNAMRGAIANDINEMVQSGQVKPGRLTTPRVKAKLDLLFGREESAAFLNRIEQEADMAARANRMAPTSGSGTFGLGEAGAEADSAMNAGDWARIAGKFMTKNYGGAAVDLAATPFKKLYRYNRTAGFSENARNAMGRVLLMGPDELIPLLQQYESLPPAVQKAVRGRAVALGLLGGNTGGRTGAASDAPE